MSRPMGHLSGSHSHAHAAETGPVNPPPFNPSASPPVLSVHKSGDHFTVLPAGYPKEAPPLYLIETSGYRRPNVVVYRGGSAPLAEAVFPSFTSKIDITLRGQSLQMKLGQLSGNYTFDAPSRGQLKWKVNKLTGSMELVDKSGAKMALYKSAGFPGSGEKTLECLEPCDDYLLDLITVTAITGVTMTKTYVKAALRAAG